MLIQIVAGTFGHQTPTGRVVSIGTGEVVEVAQGVGQRLIERGCAVEAQLIEPASPEPNESNPESEAVKYNISMSREQLEKIGGEIYGLDQEDMAAAKNKAELIAMLDEAKAEFEEAAPDLNAADAIV